MPSAAQFLDAPADAPPKAADFLEAPSAQVATAPAAVDPAQYETKLSTSEETKFQQWKAKNAPNDSGNDYDFRGAYKAGLAAADNGHWSDEFKKPNHPTFSVESKYAASRPELAGSWDGDKYVPPSVQPKAVDFLDARNAPSAAAFLDAPTTAPSAAAFLDAAPVVAATATAPVNASDFLNGAAPVAPALVSAKTETAPTPAAQAAAKSQWAKAGPLEKLGMLWKHFSYDKSVEQAFTPSSAAPQIPAMAQTGGAAAQVGKALANTGSGVINSLSAPGFASLITSPGSGLYALPYFAEKAFKDIPDAWRSFFDPKATAGDRTQKTAAAVMDTLATLGLGKKATGDLPNPRLAPQTIEKFFTGGARLADAMGLQKTAAKLTDVADVSSGLDTKMAGIEAGIKNRAAASPVRDQMTFSRDAADNNAERTANVTSNDIRGPLRRTFGDNAGKAENSLSFVVEGLNDPTNLDVMRQKVDASTAASPKWKQAALDAIDFAKANFAKLKPIAEQYSDATLKQWKAEQQAGQTTPYRPGYVMHAQDIADPAGFESISGSSGGDGAAGFKMMRTHDTLADSIAAGVDPKSINAVDLLRSRLATGMKMVNKNAWADSLQDLKDPTSGKPVATNAVTETRPDGTTYSTVPEGYQAEQFGNRTLAVHKGYGGIFSSITDPSAFSKNEVGSVIQKANATGKAVNLLLDTFHLGRIAMWDSAIRASGLKTFKAPIPSYRQGLTLMDHSPDEITKMAQAGEVPQSWLPKVLQNKATLDLLEKNGMNSGRVADAMHQEWVRKIPGIGQFNKFVFEKFQRGAMSEIGLLEHERQRAMYPDLSDNEVARKVAKDVNTRFGNFGRQGILTNKTFQDIARLILLAPQWNEGLIKSEIGAVKQGADAVKDAVVNRRLASGMLARGTATMVLGQLAANQLINYYTRGKPTWENQEEGPSAKLSAWIPDKIGGGPGFFLNPTALAAETTHSFSKSMEKDPDFVKALDTYSRARLSAGMRPLATLALRTDSLGRPIKPEDLMRKTLAAATPVPIASDTAFNAGKQLASGQPSESFAGQYQKQLMATFGQKMDNAPSAEQRVYQLARDFNRSKNVPPRPDTAAGPFEPFTNALRVGNKNDARDSIEKLLQLQTPLQVAQHFQREAKATFTGSHAREREFLSTMSDEQKATYKAARTAKIKLEQDALRALHSYLIAAKEAPAQP